MREDLILGTKACIANVLALPRLAKRIIVIALDVFLCVLSVWLAFYLRLGEFVNLSGTAQWEPMKAVIVSVTLVLPIFYVGGIYQSILRYSGWYEFSMLTRSVAIYSVIFSCVFLVVGVDGVPRTVGVIQPILLIVIVSGSRLCFRLLVAHDSRTVNPKPSFNNVLIFGAGAAGRQLAAGISKSRELKVAGFLDDDTVLHGRTIDGIRVYSPASILELKEKLEVRNVFLAMPKIDRNRRNEILDELIKAKVTIRTLPSYTQLMREGIALSDVRDLDLDDLLARKSVLPDYTLLNKAVVGKVILVTGAGGSIGSELCRQIVAMNATKLVLVEQNEYALYSIHQELASCLGTSNCYVIPVLASVADRDRIGKILSEYMPDTIFHAAAYKHVPLVEQNPFEGISNNTFGTLTISSVASELGIPNFVLISTDKAVRPTNIMGASKRLAEMVLQALAHEQNLLGTNRTTIFSMVRFGNVLGSSGSVVPRFRKQILDGGPVTVTHPQITRYFMSISEAAQLVIQASALANGGEVFVLDMHEPVKIMDLAIRMINLSGLTVRDEENPFGDIEINVVGLRPGEKLFEELLIGNNPEATSHIRIMKSHEEFYPMPDLKLMLDALKEITHVNDLDKLKPFLTRLNIGYQPSASVSE